MKKDCVHLSIPNCPAELSAWIEAEGESNHRRKASQAIVLMELARAKILEERKSPLPGGETAPMNYAVRRPRRQTPPGVLK